MRVLRNLTAVGGLLALALAGPISGAYAHGWSSSVVGHVYVNDNTAPANTIAGYARHADGTLTRLPGSPFQTGGSGAGATVGSQGALQSADHGRYLLAVDAGSNQVSVLAVEADGSLRAIPGGVVSSDGIEPVSIAVHGRLVYVANAGVDDSGAGEDYTGFWLGWGGHLNPVAGSTVALPDGSTPGDVLFNSTGTNLVGTRVGTSLIDSFAVGRDGLLTAAAGSPFAAQGPGPFGSEFSPRNPSQLFVSNAHGGAGNGTVSAFDVAWDGTLSSIGDSPFPDDQTAPCWVTISADGRYLFAVNTAVPSISSYSIAADGSLSLLGSTAFKFGSGLGPFDAQLSPDGRSLWVVGSAGNVLSGFAVRGGSLRELASSPVPLPAGATAFGIVVN